MLVTLARIIKYGWQDFLRNGLLSVSTVLIMFLAAFVFEGLILFNVLGKNAIQSIQEKIDISVYFKSNTSEDFILNIKRSLEGLAEVQSVEYVSQEKALEEFKTRHGGEEKIIETLEELDINPLLASLNIKARDPREYVSIASYLENPALKENIDKVTYTQNQLVIDRLIALIDTIKQIGLFSTIFFAFLAVVVTFNTIRLAIFSSSEQISIMRLVGASNSFIRGPYIIEGIIYGVIAALISFLIFIPLINFASPNISKFIPEANLLAYFQNRFLVLFFYQLAFCIGLGTLSSVFAIRRHLRV